MLAFDNFKQNAEEGKYFKSFLHILHIVPSAM
jgi:hypothetical protein